MRYVAQSSLGAASLIFPELMKPGLPEPNPNSARFAPKRDRYATISRSLKKRHRVHFRSHNEDRDCAVCQHLDGLAAEHDRRHAPAPMRSHDDEIAAALFRGINDRLIRLRMLLIHCIA